LDPALQLRLRAELASRRERLAHALRGDTEAEDLIRLMMTVDAALERLDTGTYGLCSVCGGAFHDHELEENPLIQYCLCNLSQEQMRSLERDLERATRIQQSLLPTQDLRHAGWTAHFRYRPAGPVSGDACDLIACDGPDPVLWFLLGDVSGKGVSAALRMAHMHALLRATIAEGVGVAELASRANRLLSKSDEAEYATLVVGRALPDGTVEMCNAGHVPPYHLGAGGPTALCTGGFPLGLIPSSDYISETVRVDPGESLVLYTDGLTEARSASGEEFGAERLVALLRAASTESPQELAAACLSELRSYLAAGRPADDMTLLVIRRDDHHGRLSAAAC